MGNGMIMGDYKNTKSINLSLFSLPLWVAYGFIIAESLRKSDDIDAKNKDCSTL